MGVVRDQIAANIAKHRKRMKLTQMQLAEALKVTNGAVSNWEKGSNSPDIETLFSMCDLFGIDVSEMYDGCNKESAPHVWEPTLDDQILILNENFSLLNAENRRIILYISSQLLGAQIDVRKLNNDQTFDNVAREVILSPEDRLRLLEDIARNFQKPLDFPKEDEGR